MATLATSRSGSRGGGDERFFLRSAIVMAAIIVFGFSLQLAMGRSTFASPIRVHIHAILFMGWVAIYLVQNILVSTNRIALHRRLGWVAAAWMVAMTISGFFVTVVMVRNGTTPFFFQPLQFLVFDPLASPPSPALPSPRSSFAAAPNGTAACIFAEWRCCSDRPSGGSFRCRCSSRGRGKRPSWSLCYSRCGGCGRTSVRGRVHPAWRWGVGTMLATFVLIQAITYSPVGTLIYDRVTAGSPAPPTHRSISRHRPTGH